jgi:NitT/TauT family transport system permease protein
MSRVAEPPLAVEARGAGPGLDAAEIERRVRPPARERVFAIASYFSPIVILALWELLSRTERLDSRFFPAPTSIADTFWEELADGRLLSNAGATMQRVAVGYAMGAIPAILLGLTLGLFKRPRQLLGPIFAALYPVPKIAIFPLLLLIFGIGNMSKYVAIAIGVFFLVFYNTLGGVMQVPRIYIDVARNAGASRFQLFRTVAFPCALPNVFIGFRLAAATSFIVVAAVEFVGSRNGIGYYIWASWQTFAVSKMYVGIVVIATMGYLTTVLIEQAERRTVPWARR